MARHSRREKGLSSSDRAAPWAKPDVYNTSYMVLCHIVACMVLQSGCVEPR